MPCENYNKLRRLLLVFEDPKFPSVGPQLRLMRLLGLWQPLSSRFAMLKKIIFYLVIGLIFSQYLKSLIKFDYASLKLILQYAPFHVGIIKAGFLKKDHKIWEDLVNYTSGLERSQLSESDPKIYKIINQHINWNRIVTYFFWTLAIVTNIVLFEAPYFNGYIMLQNETQNFVTFDVYTPFSGDQPFSYFANLTIQAFMGIIISAYTVSWDMLVVSLMIFFTCQLRVARYNCANLIDRENHEESHKNLVDFHQHYINLVR